MGFEIRELSLLTDFTMGFFETLYNLAPDPIDIGKATIRYEELRRNDLTKTFVAVDTDTLQIIGTASLVIDLKFIHNCSEVGRLEDVSVRKGFERRGIGSSLVRAVIEAGKTAGCYKIILGCNTSNVNFYEKLGFFRESEQMRMNLK